MEPVRSRHSQTRAPAALVVAALLSLGAGFLLSGCGDEPAGPKPLDASSPYTNTKPGVGYVGVQVCAECHPGEYESYRETPHSRAFRPIVVGDEPLPATVDHERSGVRYDMLEQDGRMRIRESVALEDGKQAVLSDFPVDFVVGSGESSLTYVTREDGFLLQSPTTWFTRPEAWAMSPGYDTPHHLGFSRALERKCLSCHVGRIDTEPESDYHVTFREDAIGCERCHGPGEAHVAFHRSDGEVGDPDLTIVVPTDLSRDLSLDVCAQCHLDDTMIVERPGLEWQDWRPGTPSRQYRIPYGLKTPSPLMKVVGHMDQMKASRCFQESGTMTCLTCHDPHGRPRPEERAAFYREKCLTCHTEESCGMDGPHRREQHADDSCIACHMPTVKTDIVHFAFTHHRVGFHKEATSERDAPVPDVVDLVPKADVSHLSKDEQERNLGMAYMRFAYRPTGDPRHPLLPLATFQDSIAKARKHLKAAYERGVRDPQLLVALAQLNSLPEIHEVGVLAGSGGDPGHTLALLEEADGLGVPIDPATRVRQLAIRAAALAELKRPKEAIAVLQSLTTLRREALDWSHLADAWREQGESGKALAAMKQAVAIRASDPTLQRKLARYYQSAGNRFLSERHRAIADALQRARPSGPSSPLGGK